MRAEASMDGKECEGKRKRKTKVDEHGLSQPAFWFNMTICRVEVTDSLILLLRLE